MPILGLTNRKPDRPALIRAGKIRKGAERKGNKPGRDLDHWRITFEPQFAELEGYITELFGAKPQKLPVMLFAHEPEKCFETWYEAWTALGLVHRCDGQRQVIGINPKTKKYEPNLLCEKGDNASPDDPSTFRCGCSRGGKLRVTIPRIWHLTNSPTIFEMETSSIHDIIYIHNRLHTLYDIYGTLMKMPIILGRQESKISYASKSAKSSTGRQSRTSWLVTITEDMKMMQITHGAVSAQMKELQTGERELAYNNGTPQLSGPSSPPVAGQLPSGDTNPSFNGDNTIPVPQPEQPRNGHDIPKITAYVQGIIPNVTEGDITAALSDLPSFATRRDIFVAILAQQCTDATGVIDLASAQDYAHSLTRGDETLKNEIIDRLMQMMEIPSSLEAGLGL